MSTGPSRKRRCFIRKAGWPTRPSATVRCSRPSPRHAGALCYLGVVTAQQGALDEGLALLRKSIASNPAAAEGHNYLGAVLQADGPPPPGGDRASRAGARPGAELSRCALSISPPRSRRWGGPWRRSPGCADCSPTIPIFPAAHFNLGLALQTVARHDEAQIHLRKAADLEPALAAQLAGLIDAPAAQPSGRPARRRRSAAPRGRDGAARPGRDAAHEPVHGAHS